MLLLCFVFGSMKRKTNEWMIGWIGFVFSYQNLNSILFLRIPYCVKSNLLRSGCLSPRCRCWWEWCLSMLVFFFSLLFLFVCSIFSRGKWQKAIFLPIWTNSTIFFNKQQKRLFQKPLLIYSLNNVVIVIVFFIIIIIWSLFGLSSFIVFFFNATTTWITQTTLNKNEDPTKIQWFDMKCIWMNGSRKLWSEKKEILV